MNKLFNIDSKFWDYFPLLLVITTILVFISTLIFPPSYHDNFLPEFQTMSGNLSIELVNSRIYQYYTSGEVGRICRYKIRDNTLRGLCDHQNFSIFFPNKKYCVVRVEKMDEKRYIDAKFTETERCSNKTEITQCMGDGYMKYGTYYSGQCIVEIMLMNDDSDKPEYWKEAGNELEVDVYIHTVAGLKDKKND